MGNTQGILADTGGPVTRRKLLRVVEIAEILPGTGRSLGSRGPMGGCRRSTVGADLCERRSAVEGALGRLGRSSPRNVWWKGPLARRSPGKATPSWLLDLLEEAGDRSPRCRYTLGLSGSRGRSDSPLDRGSELAVVHSPVLCDMASGRPRTIRDHGDVEGPIPLEPVASLNSVLCQACTCRRARRLPVPTVCITSPDRDRHE